MTLFSAILVFVLIWWMMFFCTLPFGVKNIEHPTDGSMPGAPVNPDLKKKLIWATALSVVVWIVVYLAITSNFYSFSDVAAHMSM